MSHRNINQWCGRVRHNRPVVSRFSWIRSPGLLTRQTPQLCGANPKYVGPSPLRGRSHKHEMNYIGFRSKKASFIALSNRCLCGTSFRTCGNTFSREKSKRTLYTHKHTQEQSIKIVGGKHGPQPAPVHMGVK